MRLVRKQRGLGRIRRGLGRKRPLVTNGTFDANTSGWTAGSATLASVTGGASGNCLRITNTAAALGMASQQISVPNGNYTLTVKHKNGTGNGFLSKSAAQGGYDEINDTLADADWALHSYAITVTGAFWLNLMVGSTTAGATTFWDDIALTRA